MERAQSSAGDDARDLTVALQAVGDRELRERLLADVEIHDAIASLERRGEGSGARRHLLATATRLTADMAPELHAIIDECRATLCVDGPLELFVYPEATLNAAAARPERGRLLLVVSSGLLEGLEPEELRFVAGHEVGHYLPPLRRAQVVRDLCLIARAAGAVADKELAVIRDIATAIAVDEAVIECALHHSCGVCGCGGDCGC